MGTPLMTKLVPGCLCSQYACQGKCTRDNQRHERARRGVTGVHAMRCRIFVVPSLVLSVLLFGPARTARAGGDTPDFSKEAVDFVHLYAKKDEHGMEQLLAHAREKEKQHSHEATFLYWHFIAEVGQYIAHHQPLSYKAVYELWGTHAKAALGLRFSEELGKGRQISVKLRIADLYYGALEYMKGARFVEERKARTGILCSLMKSVEEGMEYEWNPHDPENRIGPYMPPPTYQGPFISGMSPEGILDPRLKAEYTLHLKRSSQIGKKALEQARYRQIQEKCYPRIAKAVAREYTREPHNFGELRDMLKSSGIRQKQIDLILAKIEGTLGDQ